MSDRVADRTEPDTLSSLYEPLSSVLRWARKQDGCPYDIRHLERRLTDAASFDENEDENEHRCSPPDLGHAPYVTRQLPWECGICGRGWTLAVGGSLAWWEETRGPTS